MVRRTQETSSNPGASTIALLDWSHLIEDVLDQLDITFDDFREKVKGGWLFGYIDALHLVGCKTVLFCVSNRVKVPLRFKHLPTGAQICILPSAAIYNVLRRRIPNPYAPSLDMAVGTVQGVRRLGLKLLKDILPYLATPLGFLASELRRENCKVILCQEYEHARFDECVLLGRLMNLPVFATFQGGDYQISSLERPLRPFTLRACAGLIVSARREMERLVSQYGVQSEKLARIFNPLDLSAWPLADRYEARAKLEIPSSARVVSWHGRVDFFRKGLDILLDAWEQICQEHVGLDLRLLLVGTGADKELLRQRLIAKQLKGVFWLDKFLTDRNEIRPYLAAADVYAFPSRHEGFPLSPIEAMACGVPVVGADIPGVSDILDGEKNSGGLTVPCGDKVALAQALGVFLTNPSLSRELGNQARLRAETCFSLEMVGSQLRTFLLNGIRQELSSPVTKKPPRP
jgi:glycosyltransferase involved in cell wall biosynthesis